MKDRLDNKTKDLFKYSSHEEYRAWHNMKQRCLNPNNPTFKYYGKKGITIHNSWLEFDNFYRDMGRKPNKSYTLERINNNKGYEPGNCKWATWEEQNNNKNPKKQTIQRENRIKAIENARIEWLAAKDRFDKAVSVFESALNLLEFHNNLLDDAWRIYQDELRKEIHPNKKNIRVVKKEE
jgi:hypothetical protein